MKRAQVALPILYLVKDASGMPLEVGTCESEVKMWQRAEELLAEDSNRKRIAFFGADLTWINALSRPGFLKQEIDILTPQEREMLLQAKTKEKVQ